MGGWLSGPLTGVEAALHRRYCSLADQPWIRGLAPSWAALGWAERRPGRWEVQLALTAAAAVGGFGRGDGGDAAWFKYLAARRQGTKHLQPAQPTAFVAMLLTGLPVCQFDL